MTKTNKTDWQYDKVSCQENGKEEIHESDVQIHYGYGVRHVQVLLFFSSLCIIYIARAHLGVTIVAMIDAQEQKTALNNNTNPNNVRTESFNESYSTENNNTDSSHSDAENEINDLEYLRLSNDGKDVTNNIFNDSLVETTENWDTKNTEDDYLNSLSTPMDKNFNFVNESYNKEMKNNVDGTIVSTREGIQNFPEGVNENSDNVAVITNLTHADSSNYKTLNNKNVTFLIPRNMTAKHKNWNVYRTYSWPKSTQEMVLGAFFLGYLIMMSPMGLVCQRWGGKLPLQIGLFSSAIITFSTPWLAAWGNYRAVALSRVVMGLCQSGTYPSLITLIASWVPISERARLSNYVYSGSMIGSIIAFQLGGFLAASSFGWPSTFWITGVLCMVAFILLTIFGAATPAEHKFISVEERNFIRGQVFTGAAKKVRTPWKAILTSVPVWAAYISHVGTSTVFLFFLTQVPSYLHFILGINVKNSGLISSLPYLANFLSSIAIGIVFDYCTNNKILTIKQARIISNTVASVVPALCLAAVSFTNSTILAVVCLIITMASLAGTHTGWMANYIDLSPNYSGTLMATGNTLMNIAALIIPILVSNIVVDVRNPYQWRIVMFIVGAFGLIGNVSFVAFMSSEKQPWNDLEPAEHEKEHTDKCKVNY